LLETISRPPIAPAARAMQLAATLPGAARPAGLAPLQVPSSPRHPLHLHHTPRAPCVTVHQACSAGTEGVAAFAHGTEQRQSLPSIHRVRRPPVQSSSTTTHDPLDARASPELCIRVSNTASPLFFPPLLLLATAIARRRRRSAARCSVPLSGLALDYPNP